MIKLYHIVYLIGLQRYILNYLNLFEYQYSTHLPSLILWYWSLVLYRYNRLTSENTISLIIVPSSQLSDVNLRGKLCFQLFSDVTIFGSRIVDRDPTPGSPWIANRDSLP